MSGYATSVVRRWTRNRSDNPWFFLILDLICAFHPSQSLKPIPNKQTPGVREHDHSHVLSPVLHLAAKLKKVDFAGTGFTFEGVAGPKGTCSPETFATGHAYDPRHDDVFVVTQMKSGTTWMQHVIYEILMRGQGDLVETGRTLYGVSPWLESLRSVSLADAPLIGAERPSRIIKTHFPTSLPAWGRRRRDSRGGTSRRPCVRLAPPPGRPFLRTRQVSAFGLGVG